MLKLTMRERLKYIILLFGLMILTCIFILARAVPDASLRPRPPGGLGFGFGVGIGVGAQTAHILQRLINRTPFPSAKRSGELQPPPASLSRVVFWHPVEFHEPPEPADSKITHSLGKDYTVCKEECMFPWHCKMVVLYAPGEEGFKLEANDKCWDPPSPDRGAKIKGKACEDVYDIWAWKGHSLLHKSTGYCLHPEGGRAAATENTHLVLWPGCGEPRLHFHDIGGGVIQHETSKLCIGVDDKSKRLVLTKCENAIKFGFRGYCLQLTDHIFPSNDKGETLPFLKAEMKWIKKNKVQKGMIDNNNNNNINKHDQEQRQQHEQASAFKLLQRWPARTDHPADDLHYEWVHNNSYPPRFVRNTRPDTCKDIPFSVPDNWTATVVMCFRNEPLERLAMSLKSILFRTLPRLLDEIIVIDEGSDTGATVAQIDDLKFPKVRALRNTPAKGLMKCRMQGANMAKSPVYVFLDSHIEVMEGWLEPLMQAALVPRVSAVPVCDIIEEDDFDYVSGPDFQRGTTDWRLGFNWESVPSQQRKSVHLPFYTPVMVGGLFAISASSWKISGGYDEEMVTWGAENVEMSFREWLCGGEIYIMPCSRIGHVFKKTFRYPLDGGVVERNQLRTALVWMDQFARVYKNASAQELMENVDKRLKLRQDLKCKPFRWYLDHVSPALRDSIPDQWKHLLLTPPDDTQ